MLLSQVGRPSSSQMPFHFHLLRLIVVLHIRLQCTCHFLCAQTQLCNSYHVGLQVPQEPDLGYTEGGFYAAGATGHQKIEKMYRMSSLLVKRNAFD